MKTFYSFVAVLGVLALTACQLPQGNTGSLKITVPSSGVSRSLAGTVSGTGDTVRLQLVRNGVIVPLNGSDVLEKTLAGQTVTVDGLPTGSGYSLRVASGTWTSDKTFFQTTYYQQSSEFEISAGAETPVTVTLSSSPVTLVAYGSGPNASVAKDDALYVTSNTGLVEAQQYPISADTLTTEIDYTDMVTYVGNTRTIQSLGVSSTGVFFNTDNGLINWVPSSTWNTEVSSVNAKQSGSFSFTVNSTNYNLDVYYGTGLTAGLRLTNVTDGTEDDWSDLETMLDVDSLPDSTRASLEKSDGLILGFGTADEKYAYIATALGTYRVSADMFTNGVDSDALADKFTGGDDSVKLIAKLNGASQKIQAVSTASDATTGYAFAGTGKGLFSGNVDPLNGSQSGDLALVSATAGLDVAGLATVLHDGVVYTAAYASDTGEVLILNGLKTVVARYARLSGLPDGDLTLSWWQPTAGLYLAVSGTNGTVVIPLAQTN